jgi:hypothetical protein
VAKLKYLETTVTNQNLTHVEVKSRLNSSNACYIQLKDLFSCLLYKIVKIKIYKTIHLYIVSYVCENWSLTLRKEDVLRVFENRMLRKIFGPKRDEIV